MKKAKVLALGAIASVLIAAATVTAFAAPNFRRSNTQNNICPNTSAVCDGTGGQNCTLKEACPYYSEAAAANGGQGQTGQGQAGQGQAGQGRGQGRGGCGNGQGRMGNRSGACRMA